MKCTRIVLRAAGIFNPVDRFANAGRCEPDYLVGSRQMVMSCTAPVVAVAKEFERRRAARVPGSARGGCGYRLSRIDGPIEHGIARSRRSRQTSRRRWPAISRPEGVLPGRNSTANGGGVVEMDRQRSS
jgi:hypothetical protein